MTQKYQVVAISATFYFNQWGDHNHNGAMYVLKENLEKVREYLRWLQADPKMPDAQRIQHEHYHLIRPLVLRAHQGQTLTIEFWNELNNQEYASMHLVGPGYDVKSSDGAWVGANKSSLHKRKVKKPVTYTWECPHEGAFVFHDAGNLSGEEDGTNLQGLFGALIVEPPDTRWRDSSTGEDTQDGLYVDIIPHESEKGGRTPWLERPVKYPEGKPGQKLEKRRAFREYVIFFHDEIEYLASHSNSTPDICQDEPDLCGHILHHEHREHPLMTISYRAEPMVSRQRELWRRRRELWETEEDLQAPVVHEEQHHSSWLFGDPATPILKAYIGDPVRIRLIHAAVKETHVFHLHLYSWHTDGNNTNSPLIDSVSIGPQAAKTIQPLWGAGNRQGAAGDVIWHCHLYPHFHEGMWGMFRTFDRLQDGRNRYPDNTCIAKLEVLPDREAPPTYQEAGLGFPNFIPGIPGQRSPLPPFIGFEDPSEREGLDYRTPHQSELERFDQMRAGDKEWLNRDPILGWTFNHFRLPNPGENIHSDLWLETPANEPWSLNEVKTRRNDQEILHLSVETSQIDYNRHGWHDPEGHLFRPTPGPRKTSKEAPPNVMDRRGRHRFQHPNSSGHGETDEKTNYQRERPLFVRACHGDVVTLELENRLPRAFCGSEFDEALPPCEKYTVKVDGKAKIHEGDSNWQADRTPPMPCGQHVHLVKFDPLVCDGAATGWNYLSGARAPFWDEERQLWKYLRMRYIWWVDEEFGVIFTHDHLFANFRQKRGLFGAMIAEPQGSKYVQPHDHGQEARFDESAVIVSKNGEAFREFCIALGDFVPLYNQDNRPLNKPTVPGHHSDHGVVGINYRSAPIRERLDPGHGSQSPKSELAYSFSSHIWGDPETPIFETRPNEPVRIRLFQGSHEEQHSFQIHGMRWPRFPNGEPRWANQQTLGISEQFSLHLETAYGPGDYLYKFASSDDLWMGAWGILRVAPEEQSQPLPLPPSALPSRKVPEQTEENTVRFTLVAESQEIIYLDNPRITDPFGLVFRREETGEVQSQVPWPVVKAPRKPALGSPLVLRCPVGSWVEITLWNKLPLHLKVEPRAPEVPVERLDRSVSSRVSLHADMVTYDVRSDDGVNVGMNPLATDQTVAPLERKSETTGHYSKRVYRWFADLEGPVLLQDFADFRNHRHHGLVGALIVEPKGSETGESLQDLVLILQDGLRLFYFGNLGLPLPDATPDPGENVDPTDQGQKAINFRAKPIGHPKWMSGAVPKELLYHVKLGKLRVHLLVAGDKPRNHVFTIHGHAWPEWPQSDEQLKTWVGSLNAMSCGMVATLDLQLKHTGDHALRSGALAWAVSQGMWSVLRVEEDGLLKSEALVSEPTEFSELVSEFLGNVEHNALEVNVGTGTSFLSTITGTLRISDAFLFPSLERDGQSLIPIMSRSDLEILTEDPNSGNRYDISVSAIVACGGDAKGSVKHWEDKLVQLKGIRFVKIGGNTIIDYLVYTEIQSA